MSKWLPLATVAIEDRRFYQHGGVDYDGHRARRLEGRHRRQGRRGRLDDHAAARAQPLHRPGEDVQPQAQGGVPRDQALAEAGRSRAILDDYLNTVYYGNHAYGVEAAAQTYFSKHAKDLTLLQSALLAGLPQAPSSTTRSTTRRRRSSGATRCCARCARSNDITPRQYRQALKSHVARPEAGPHLHAHQAAVLLHLRDRRARASVRREHRPRGRAQGLHDDRPAPAAQRDQGDPRHPAVPHRPGRGDRLGRAGHRRDPRDDRRHRASRATSSTSLRSRRGRRARRSRRSCSPRRSRRASTPTRPTTPRRRSRATIGPWCNTTEAVGRAHLRQHLQRHGLDHARDAALRQHGLRAADARRRPELRLADWRTASASTCRRTSPSPRSGSARSPSRRSTWPPPTRRSPRSASTRSRWRSRR